ncbi:transglycosylase SLT domain-containing protein, partial [Escherichia coli]|uniref:transglycosylase SLT domain-containing protein n=1 Tax=Escherichia coli TaxID=562 RepID=UPI0021176A22
CGGFFSQACAAHPPQDSLQYRDDVIRNARLEWGLSAPVADFAAQLHQESGWRADAISPAGAQGLAQFMPATADWLSLLIPMLSSREPFNP